MIIDLIAENPNRLSFGVGDILIFYNDKEYDFHQVVFDSHGATFGLLALEDSSVNEKWNSITDMVEDLNKVNNGFELVEILKPDEVVIRRVVDE